MPIKESPAPSLAPTAKYQHLAAQIRRQIECGTLAPGDRLPSFGAMREQFGATAATTERVYSLLEREQLIVREHRRGVFVAPPRRALLRGVVGLAGGALKDGVAQTPYWTHLLAGVQQVAERENVQILLLSEAANAGGWNKVDGLLLLNHHLENALRGKDLPVVSLLHPMSEMNSVAADDAEGVRQAVVHLHELGHTRIGCLMALHSPLSQRRLSGYREALWDLGLACEPSLAREVEYDPQLGARGRGRQSMAAWLQDGWTPDRCTALLTQNDEVAIGAMEALREAGISVPQQVSVVGFDGTEISEYSKPSLTTIELPLHEIGARAMEMLLARIGNEDSSRQSKPENVLLPAHLVVRESTGPAPS